MYRFVALGIAMLAGAAIGAAALNEIAGRQARAYPAGYRTDVIDVPIQSNSHPEYYVRMKTGDTMVYSWEVLDISDPQLFYTDFHTHAVPEPGLPGDMISYQRSTGSKANGSLVAPWQGIHGWYWENKSEAPVVVHLRMAGFYELISGQDGQPVKE
jgi:hypothetical protein